jgi:hypothetical protein
LVVTVKTCPHSHSNVSTSAFGFSECGSRPTRRMVRLHPGQSGSLLERAVRSGESGINAKRLREKDRSRKLGQFKIQIRTGELGHYPRLGRFGQICCCCWPTLVARSCRSAKRSHSSAMSTTVSASVAGRKRLGNSPPLARRGEHSALNVRRERDWPLSHRRPSARRQFGLFNRALCTKLIVTRMPFPRVLSTLKSVSTFSRKV